MNPRIVQQAGFDVIGIEARTNNQREMSGLGVIGGQWQRFMQEAILLKIPNRADDVIYALYTGYAGNRNGDYDFVIGARVTAHDNLPEGMVVRHIPDGTYAVLTSDKGPVYQVVPQAWQQIWKMEDEKLLGGKRVYRTDFEVYGPPASDPHAAQVDLYVGLK